MNDTRLPIEPGHLDRRVTIQAVTQGQDSAGVPIETVAKLATVWMGRMALSGLERFISNQESAQFDAKWLMHYRADMDPDLVDVPAARRLVYQGRGLDIVNARHVGMKAGIELTTRASSKVAA